MATNEDRARLVKSWDVAFTATANALAETVHFLNVGADANEQAALQDISRAAKCMAAFGDALHDTLAPHAVLHQRVLRVIHGGRHHV